MTSKPLVSVLMTAYNRENYIAEAIESLLSSTYENYELIIVDDCSKDNTLTIAKRYAAKDSRIKVFLNEGNLGDYPNRNKAAEYAQGKYIKYLDSDDVIYPHGLEVMVRSIEAFPEAGFALCSSADVKRPFPILIHPRESYLENFYGYGHFNRAPGSAIILREAFEKVGRFSGERMIGDNDLWFKLAMYYPLVKIPPNLYWDRKHENQERQSIFAKEEYPRLWKMVRDRYFAHPDCPLNSDEKQKILEKQKKAAFKNRLIAIASNIKK